MEWRIATATRVLTPGLTPQVPTPADGEMNVIYKSSYVSCGSPAQLFLKIKIKLCKCHVSVSVKVDVHAK